MVDPSQTGPLIVVLIQTAAARPIPVFGAAPLWPGMRSARMPG